ncbi:MAG: lamin tail domain-containing protein [Deltaproteobacteria bacterium]|nr:lamin tail domain-containing protein [Deltaproteobacteria bacterium]
MKTFNAFLLLFALTLFACSTAPSQFHSALEQTPYITDLQPSPQQFLSKLEKVQIQFSQTIDSRSIASKNIFMVQGILEEEKYSDVEAIQKEIDAKKLKLIGGTLPLPSDKHQVDWVAENPIQFGNCTLVLSPDLKSESQIPFNQKPGESAKPLLVHFYLPAVSGESSGSSGSGENTGGSGNGSGGENPGPVKNRPTTLMLNEVLYDASGSDTDGNEFIELFGTPGTDLDGYQVIIVNGSDGNILDTLTLPENTKIPEDGIFVIADAKTNQSNQTNILNFDLIDNFDPQNGPDAIQLLDHQGKLLDALAYGSGNVTSAQNGLATGEGSSALKVSAGHSLSRLEGEDTQDNGSDFHDLATPTPGVK